MQAKRLLVIFFTFIFVAALAQPKESVEDVDAHSLELYNQARWKELITYAKDKIHTGIDFPLLRMRLGYAYFLQGKYAQSLIQYNKVHKDEPQNQTALYYVYLNNIYLNNNNEARYYASKMSEASKKSLAVKELKLSNVETEFSYKSTNTIRRGDANYLRLGIGLNLGYKLELQQSGALYNQTIDEPGMIPLGVFNFQNINIQQKEYYAKASFTAVKNLSLVGGYHYINTPFNNLSYQNSVLFGSIKYTTPFIHLKAIANTATVSNKSYTQFDISASTFPLGNTKLYTISRGSINDSNFIFTQILGAHIIKNVWLEGNATFGAYDVLLDNDALYLYNDIDRKKLKYGASIYAQITKNMMFSFNYTYEEKSKYGVNNFIFNQQNFTGGLQWKF